ncbi:MAG: DUF1501 domain-containing protein [Acidobacteria bacterium]|nr:DUF1501 domain-containing protein [Acidobacteriota bacterium]
MAYGSTDDFGFGSVEKAVHRHDRHATLLHLLGLDRRRGGQRDSCIAWLGVTSYLLRRGRRSGRRNRLILGRFCGIGFDPTTRRGGLEILGFFAVDSYVAKFAQQGKGMRPLLHDGDFRFRIGREGLEARADFGLNFRQHPDGFFARDLILPGELTDAAQLGVLPVVGKRIGVRV